MIDAKIKEAGHQLVLLPDGITEDQLIEETKDTDLILMCYTPVTRLSLIHICRCRRLIT